MLEVKDFMDKFDFNGNGTIDYSEFLIANIDLDKLMQEEKLKEAFDLFDLDHSGTITIDELKKILGNGGASEGDTIEDKEWEMILDEVDEDGNGEIDFEEFKFMMHKLLGIEFVE